VKRYIVSADARADLDEIWDYIAGRSSAETASMFLWRFYDAFASLAQSPSAGVAVPGLGEDSARKFPMGNYLIYYRPMRGKVMIWRVLHGKRIQLRALRSHPRRPRV
jgi:toxin ParE1/3/4